MCVGSNKISNDCVAEKREWSLPVTVALISPHYSTVISSCGSKSFALEPAPSWAHASRPRFSRSVAQLRRPTVRSPWVAQQDHCDVAPPARRPHATQLTRCQASCACVPAIAERRREFCSGDRGWLGAGWWHACVAGARAAQNSVPAVQVDIVLLLDSHRCGRDHRSASSFSRRSNARPAHLSRLSADQRCAAHLHDHRGDDFFITGDVSCPKQRAARCARAAASAAAAR